MTARHWTLPPGSGPTALVVAIYAALSIVAFLPVLPFDNSHLLATAPNDSTDVGWFLSWSGYAVSHGHNPFFTDWMEFPTGINIPANQSMPLLGVLATPITVWLGPFAMMNLTMRLSFLASALAMYFTLRYFCDRRLTAFVGGLFFGFCPFLVAHNLENQNFSFLPALPLIFLFAYKLVSGESRSVRKDGLLLGLLCAVQLYLNPEPLAEILVVLVVTSAVVLLVRARRMARTELRALFRGAVAAAVVFVVLALPFAYYYLAGPQHTSGPVVGLQYLAVFHTDLAQLVIPDRNQIVGPASLIATGSSFSGGAINETGSYLGIPLLVGLVFFVIRFRRVRAVAFSAVVFLIALVLSLGPELYIDNKDTGIPLPARLLLHFPVLNSAETIRYFVIADVAAAVILAVGLDRLVAEWQSRSRAHGAGGPKLARGRTSPSVLVIVIAAVLLFPLIPRWPYLSNPIGVPAYFTSSEVNAIAPGATVMTYPIAQSGAVQPMQWQMAAGFRFKIVSGYGYLADNGGVTLGNPPMKPPTLAMLENVASGNDTSDAIPTVTLRNLLRIRELLANLHVDDFLMQATGKYQVVDEELSIALGRRPESVGGMLVWYRVRSSLAESLHTIVVHDRRQALLKAYPPVGT